MVKGPEVAAEQGHPLTELEEKERREVTRAAVVGATGYAGRELIAWLARHPLVGLTHLMASGRSGTESVPIGDLHPSLRGVSSLPCQPLDTNELRRAEVDVVFLATPHEPSYDLAPQLLDRGLRVVDLSGAFRLREAEAYARWYGFDHRAGSVLREAVYGLPELNRERIAAARLVANPGCYATSIILALAPVLRAGWVDDAAGINCDSKSGATGAGRTLRDDLLFSNVNENCRAYGLFAHRHVPEILQALSLEEGSLTFVPHLLPLTRGILSTVYVRLMRRTELAELQELYRSFYRSSPFVRVYEATKVPAIQAVAGTPYADLGFALDPPTGRLVIVSVLDNLGKGGATQAIENMNLMLGFEQETGLR